MGDGAPAFHFGTRIGNSGGQDVTVGTNMSFLFNGLAGALSL